MERLPDEHKIRMFVVGPDGKLSLIKLPLMVATALVFSLKHGGKSVGVITKTGIKFIADILMYPKR